MIRFISMILILTSLCAFAESEHEKHHPKGGPSQGQVPGPGQEAAGPGGPGGMAAGMGEMMKKMGAKPKKEFYPSLMDIPKMSNDVKTKLQQQARERMRIGAVKIDSGLKKLTELAGGQDFQALKSATNEMREGLAEFDSGIATQQALEEGKPPSDIAIKWFKDSMNISEPQDEHVTSSGLSVFHIFVMSLLTIFMVVMVIFYFKKMRRASDLITKLQTPNNPAPTAGPPSAAPPATAGVPPAAAPKPPVPPTAAAPVVLPTAVPPAAPKASHWKGKLLVAAIYEETPSVKTFKLASPDHGDLPFTYEAGQFLNLFLTIDGKPLNRAYSISSHPCDRKVLELTIKREEHGLVSRYMYDIVREGDSLNIEAASGTLTFSDLGDRSIVLMGGGVGITPLMSVLRCILSCGMKNKIYLFYSCKTIKDFVFRDEIELLQKRNSKFKVFLALHTLDGSFPGAIEGHFTKEKIKESVPDLKSARIHVCGPPTMMEDMRIILKELEVPQDQIKSEVFATPKKDPAPSAEIEKTAKPAEVPKVPNPEAVAAPDKNPTNAVVPSAVAPPAVPPPAAPPPAAEATSPPANAPNPSPEVAQGLKKTSFTISKQEVPSNANESVLEVSERVGINIPYICRVGTCGACKTKLISGQVKMAIQDALTEDDKKQNFILACQAILLSDISVEV